MLLLLLNGESMDGQKEKNSKSPNLEAEKDSLHIEDCENLSIENTEEKSIDKECDCKGKTAKCENCRGKDYCEIFKNNIEQKLEEAKQSVEKHKSSKGKLWSFLFLLLNIIVFSVIIIVQINSEEGLSFASLVESIGDRWWCLLLALLSFAVFMFLESGRMWLLLKSSTKHNRPFLSYKVSSMGLYYDNITPFAVGGQPFQIFYLVNRGVKPSIATGIPLAKTIFSQLALVVAGVCVLIFSKIIAGGLSKVTYYAAVMGIVVQLVLTLSILLLAISKRIAPAIVKGILKFLAKIKIIKNSEQTFSRVMEFVREYQLTMQYLMTSPFTFLLAALDTFVLMCARICIPFFIVCAFVGFDIQLYGTVFIITILIDAIMSYIPWPGASGVAEASFVMLFSHPLINLSGSDLVWAMLLWRICTYYILLLQGVVIILYDYLHGNKKIPKTIEYFKKLDQRRLNKSKIKNKESQN